MNTNEQAGSKSVSPARVIRFVIGVIVFGLLMGMRSEFESHWTRSLVAVIASAVLGICILPMRRRA
jgi:uncharacterized protein (DUF983 family)